MANKLHATIAPLLNPGKMSPSRVASPDQLRSGQNATASLAKDVDSLNQNINSIITTMQQPTTMSQLLLRDSQGHIVAALGDFTFNGVYYTNYFNEIHVGNPLRSNNPNQALFNANLDGSVIIGQHGWLDVKDPFNGSAAWIGTQFDTLNITGAVNNGAGLIRLLVPNHTLITGNTAEVRNMQNAGVPNATGTWVVTVIDSSHLDLQGSVFAGAFALPPVLDGIPTAQPTIDRVLQIASTSDNGAGLTRVVTTVDHGYISGDQVNVPTLARSIIAFVNNTTFDLLNKTYTGAPAATVLRYFAGILANTIAIGPSFIDFRLREFADGSLRINNATITLKSPTGEIILDPTVPSVVLLDGSGNPTVTLELLQEDPIAITAATNASPSVLTVPGHTYVNGDTVLIAGALGNTAINGHRIVEHLSGPGGTFDLTDLSRVAINGNGAYTGSGTSARYYAGLVAQALAIGQSFTNYSARFFADGQVIIDGAVLHNPQLDSPTVTGGFSGNITGVVPTSVITVNSGVITSFTP